MNQWKAKDTALYLITSLSARAVTVQGGATKTNEFIEILPIFINHILPELNGSNQSHPIITVDAIQFLIVFRSQLSKEQMLQVLPMLGNQLASNNYVIRLFI